MILTDSKTACQILQKSNTSDYVENSILQLLKIMHNYNITIQWIPAHVGIVGNEMADGLAKETENQNPYEKELTRYKDTVQQINKTTIEEYEEWNKKILMEGKGLKCNYVIDKFSNKTWYNNKNIKISPKHIKILNRLITGHDYSDYYLKQWKIKDTNLCEKCNTINTAYHIIFECAKYQSVRIKYRIKSYISTQCFMKSATNQEIYNLIDFINENNIIL